jgi:small subunit ribosomal protein S8
MVNKKDKFTNFLIGDFLIRVKNTAMAKNKSFTVKSNKHIVAIAEALKKTHFVDGVKVEKGMLTVSLAFKDKKPQIMDIKLVSKPGLRIYLGVDEIEKKKGPSIFLISTPKGVISSLQAIKDRVGGEVIAEIW